MKALTAVTSKDNLSFAFVVSLDDFTYLQEDLLEQALHRFNAALTVPDKAAAVNSLIQMIAEGRKGRRKLSKATVAKVYTSVVSRSGETP